MRTVVMSILAATLVAGGSTMRAMPDQTRPGEMTEAKVWIQNRSRTEAIPVNLRSVDLEAPLRVQVANGDTNPHSVRVAGPLRVQLLKQEWDYDTLVIAAGTSPVQALKSLGLAGWETTGVAWMAAEQTTLLLKRPR
jgi:hypothetical protein